MSERSDNVHYKNQRSIKNLSASTWLIIAAIVGLLGYFAGSNHYQIEAAIGPVFGYKAHSASIDLSSLEQTYNKLAGNFDGQLDTQKLIDGANGGLVAAAGDQYTVYMSAKDASDFQNLLQGNIGGGIGAEIGLRNGSATVIRTLPGDPAAKAGLQAGDAVIGINGQSTTGWSVDKVVDAIRGQEGTTVKVTIERAGVTKDFTITRATITSPSVESKVDGDIGVLTISRFDDSTADSAQTAAQEFVSKHVKGIILDLRGDPGGSVDAARDVASLWLDNKTVVTERSGGVVKETLTSGSDPTLAGIPTVVLINGSTASASEIVTGALQDYHVATVIGEKSFGKGCVQEILDLGGGAQLKVTVAKWYTPSGKNISNNGILPDKAVDLTQADLDKGVDPQYSAAKSKLGQ